jgi:ABC-type Fe3+-siderophore transport system permease subunit
MRILRLTVLACTLLGAAFGLAVVLFADCAGPTCARERVLGVAMHAAIGLGLGLVLGGVFMLVQRMIRSR